jgi:tetratricopeptide (TPR) repeat protein
LEAALRALAFVLLATALGAQTLLESAGRYFSERRYNDAIAALEQHLKSNPGDLRALMLLGLAHQQAERLPEAEAAFRQAVQRNSRHAGARYSLARVQYLRARFAEALESVAEAARLGEPPARVEYLRGLIAAERNLPEDAIAHFRAATKADPLFEPAWTAAGKVLFQMRRHKEAEASLAEAIRLRTSASEARYHRARLYLEQGAVEQARRDLEAAGSHEPARRLLDQLKAGGTAPFPAPISAVAEAPPVPLEEVAASSGLRFAVENHPTPRKHLVETMAGGLAVFDVDRDGLVDIFFTNGAELPSLAKSSPRYANRLFRNEGDWKFRDVTRQWSVSGEGYSMGAAAGDFDNDGRVDLFVAGVNRNVLYRNTGKRFDDITRRAGIGDEPWSVAAAWLDFDKDGLLDLFVVNYVRWTPVFDFYCGDKQAGLRVYCHPRHFEGLPNTLYRNLGNGRFEDVSSRAGIRKLVGKGMSAAVADYDSDGYPDIFVANDALPNFLFRNRGDGTFEETALAAGVAYTDEGKAVSGMGADFRDYDNDGLPDLLFTALTGETFPLLRNLGGGFFRDVTWPSGLGMLTIRRSGWSVALADFNNDGWKDIFSANAHVTDNIEAYSSDVYRQMNGLYLNRGGRFEDGSKAAGESFQRAAAHRGAAVADFDNDGRLDVVVSVLGAAAELWRNRTPAPGNWVQIQLEGAESNRDGIGARIQVNGQWNQRTSSAGYASSSLAPVHFGLGQRNVTGVSVIWPSGLEQRFNDVPAGRILHVKEPSRPSRQPTK